MTTLLQTDTDPALRGRLLGIYATIFAGLQPLGTVAYGLIAAHRRLFNAIGVGALLVGRDDGDRRGHAVVQGACRAAPTVGRAAGPPAAPDTLA